MSKPETTNKDDPITDCTTAPDPEDEFYGGIWWVKAADAFGLRSASPGECATEIKRLRAALMEVVKATDAGAYFTARRAAGLATGVTDADSQTTLPTSVPWPATDDKSAYIAKLWLEAGRRRREAARLARIIPETIAEAERIEALAKELDSQW